MGVHMPTLGDADPGIPNRGVAPVHVRPARCGAAGTTAGPQTLRNPATWRDLTVHIKNRFPCTYTPLSDVRLPFGTKSCRSHLTILLVKSRKPQDMKPPRIEVQHGDRRRSFGPHRVSIPDAVRVPHSATSLNNGLRHSGNLPDNPSAASDPFDSRFPLPGTRLLGRGDVCRQAMMPEWRRCS